MDIWKKLMSEFIDIIEWIDDSNNTLVHRFERYQNEIKYGAQLTVRESQVAVFVNEGQIADIFEPGRYELKTENMPILTTLKSWKHGFDSPFKAEIYFVNTRNFTDLKWGTQNPVMLRDPEFGPIRLRAFGTYAIRVNDPGTLILEIVGTDGHFTLDEITQQLRNFIVSRFAEVVGGSNIPVLDLAANYDDLSKFIEGRIKGEFKSYGLELTSLLIENISLPPKVEETLDKKSSMGIVGDLNKYMQFQSAEAIEKAANNPSGGAGEGVGMGMGFAIANQMMHQMSPNSPQQVQQVPPPLMAQAHVYVALNGQQSGPHNLDALKQLIANKQVDADTLVWKQGMANWNAASTVPEVASLFNVTPPPIPE